MFPILDTDDKKHPFLISTNREFKLLQILTSVLLARRHVVITWRVSTCWGDMNVDVERDTKETIPTMILAQVLF